MSDSLFSLDANAAQGIAQSTTLLESDGDLIEVSNWFRTQSDLKSRFGNVLRQSIDEVLDGQRTGRFNLKELEKTEKTYLGTKVEIVVRAEFELGRGTKMDFLIDGHEVDAKFTSGDNWTIPGEADGHICLLIKANDHRASYQVGLIKISDAHLNHGKNRDGKRTLSAAGRNAIEWLVKEGELPENILLTLPDSAMKSIFENKRSGQARTNELFMRVQEKLINRNTVLTVARQDDSPKRVRDARSHLRNRGIIILGHQGQHPRIARDLGLPVPTKGSWVSTRITELEASSPGRESTQISGRIYAVWKDGDPSSVAPDKY
ncbi:restriction endonuclease [Streptomyces sp. SID4946]|uniref:NaeI family type II restriction endonuclease n=1 Tax=Streptomyces sp. LamerLS-31b TaxID=1839765 RepID=UPI00081D38B1|nr:MULTISPECIES: NaeI family type II restriction endonuclease [unclassified Streptomyces]MYQ91239.1 restriction endonuclease [Streptomyces sp. SID4946]SCF66068.1 Restriction endonuclease NaeI [Streptomyces sp. DconLS]SCF80329.1 Restriction endonuclease NaeI [Streptomyces sp. LamerLS-31b]